MARHNEVGKIGEDLAVKHLVKQGFKILERNYRKKWGEIDVIAEKNKILHFVEVKSVSCVTDFDDYIPEENVTYSKRKKLARIIETYLAEVTHETDFQIDVAAVYCNLESKDSKIRLLEDIIL